VSALLQAHENGEADGLTRFKASQFQTQARRNTWTKNKRKHRSRAVRAVGPLAESASSAAVHIGATLTAATRVRGVAVARHSATTSPTRVLTVVTIRTAASASTATAAAPRGTTAASVAVAVTTAKTAASVTVAITVTSGPAPAGAKTANATTPAVAATAEAAHTSSLGQHTEVVWHALSGTSSSSTLCAVPSA
jgi:hypothetical protein